MRVPQQQVPSSAAPILPTRKKELPQIDTEPQQDHQIVTVVLASV